MIDDDLITKHDDLYIKIDNINLPNDEIENLEML